MSTIQSVAIYPEIEPESGAGYTPAYRQFFGRLRRARIERGISLAEMAKLVGLPLQSAHDFENLAMPLPFEWIEAWCKVVGVPFADYLAVYWAMEEADFEAQERDAAQKEAAQNAPCITNTESEADAPSNASVSRGGWLWPLRAALDRIAIFFRSLFSTP